MPDFLSAIDPKTIGDQNKKAPRIRSVAYPSYTISSCVELVEKIDKEFTSITFTPKDSISKYIGLTGGAFFMHLSSCVQYDLLQLKSNEGYKPTQQFKKIQKPLPSENVNDLLLECLNHPDLYKKLIGEFKDKQLPTESGLANILDRIYSVKGNASKIAAKVFLKNLATLGLITEGNILKFDSYISFIEEEEVPAAEEKSQTTLLVPVTLQNKSEKKEQKENISEIAPKEIPIFFKDGTEGKVVLPKNFTEEHLRRVLNVINGYLQ